MDFPPRRTMTAKPTSWRKQRRQELEVCRCALLGNSFQCGVFAWLLAHWAVHAGFLNEVPTVEEMRRGEVAVPTNAPPGPVQASLVGGSVTRGGRGTWVAEEGQQRQQTRPGWSCRFPPELGDSIFGC